MSLFHLHIDYIKEAVSSQQYLECCGYEKMDKTLQPVASEHTALHLVHQKIHKYLLQPEETSDVVMMCN